MRAGPIVVGSLLQNRNRFCVPIYQRHYVWTRQKQWEPFWNDIRTKAIERLAGRERRFSHFMGAVVLEARGGFSARRVPSFQVVDGQQRLTTFQVFLAAARDYARMIKHAGAAESIGTYLLNRDPHLMDEPDIEVFKVWPTQYDRALFTDLISMDGREAIKKKYRKYFHKGKNRDYVHDYSTVPNLLRAYGYFYDRIRHAVETDDLDDEFAEVPETEDEAEDAAKTDVPRELKLDAIWQSLVEEFKVVEIVLEEGDDAQVIFETLNERGEPLLAADLVRNNIFHRADAAKEKAEKLFEVHWKPFEDPFWSVSEKQGRYKKPRIEFFLANFIAGQIAGEVNLSKLFSEYKAFNKIRKYSTVAEELTELGRYGAIYREIVGRGGDTPLSTFSQKLQPWDVTTVFPLVMRLWAADGMSDDDKKLCLDMLLSFIVRRAVCGLTTKNYNKFFLTAIASLDKDGWGTAKLRSFLLSQKSETGRFPRDDEFSQRWASEPLYTSIQPARVRALLDEIESAKRGRYHETTSIKKDLTVEHVMPREWRNFWPLADGTLPTADDMYQALLNRAEEDTPIGRIARRNRLKETIGNLTLLTQPLNSSVSNGPYADKRAGLEEHSLLVLNREIIREPAWDEEAITRRSNALFGLALGIWTMPVIEVDEKAIA